MKNVFTIGILFLSLLSPSFTFSSEWKHIKRSGSRDNEINVYSKEVLNSQLPEFKATAVIAAETEEILVVYRAPNSVADWLLMCTESEKLADLPDGDGYYVYLYFDLPWPLTDRDAIVRVEKVEKDGTVTITGTGESNYIPEKKGAIRMPKISNKWQIIPENAVDKFVSFQAHVELAGRIPNWAVEIVTTKIPVHTLRNIEQIIIKNRKK